MNLIEKILSDVSLDPKVKNGMFSVENNDHMDVLRSYLVKRGLNECDVIEFCNRVVEGKYPERQAFNTNGILVTFPTPEYKQRALQRGTHFEEDPSKREPNVFGAQPKAPETAAQQKPAAPDGTVTSPKTDLPLSKAEPGDKPDSQQPVTTSAPETVPPTELPPPIPKSDAEREADKNLIKKILSRQDSVLQEAVTWFVKNAPIDVLDKCR